MLRHVEDNLDDLWAVNRTKYLGDNVRKPFFDDDLDERRDYSVEVVDLSPGEGLVSW